MPKGLFTVFHDNQPAHPRRAPSASAASAPTNNKPFAIWSDAPPSKLPLGSHALGKENLDPSHRSKPLGKAALGGNKPALVSKLAPPTTRPSSSLVNAKATAAATGNGVCTGLLRTRVLPAFDDPPTTAPIPAPSNRNGPVPPSPAYSVASTSSLHSEALGGSMGTPNSARDSGYARSPSSSPGSASEGEDGREAEGWARRRARKEEEKTVQIHEIGSTRRRRSTRKQEISDKEADRRARDLTESPLAEVRLSCHLRRFFSLSFTS